MTLGAAVMQVLLITLCIAAIFGALAWRRFHRRGVLSLLPLWAGTALVLGALAAVRLFLVLQNLTVEARRPLALAFGETCVAFLAIALTPPALALRRRAQRSPTSSVSEAAWSSAGWSLLGVLLATVIAVTLDVLNVPFFPLPGRH